MGRGKTNKKATRCMIPLLVYEIDDNKPTKKLARGSIKKGVRKYHKRDEVHVTRQKEGKK